MEAIKWMGNEREQGKEMEWKRHVNDQPTKPLELQSSRIFHHFLHFLPTLLIALIFENAISRAHSLEYQAHI